MTYSRRFIPSALSDLVYESDHVVCIKESFESIQCYTIPGSRPLVPA